MPHAIHRVLSFEIIGPYGLRVQFQDGVSQDIDFLPVLRGPLFGPLRDLPIFNAVQLDDEVYTLAWPNGADFDPETLHDWPDVVSLLIESVSRWKSESDLPLVLSREA